MRRKEGITVVLFLAGATTLLLLTVAACAPASPTAETGAPPASTPATTAAHPSTEDTPTPALTIVSTLPVEIEEDVSVPTSPTIPIPSSPGLEEIVLQVKDDLAQRLSIDPAKIDLVELKAVVWPDGSLGCPEPGVAYIQVQQEGMLIRLRVGKRVYPYHSGGGRPPFLCEHPSKSQDVPLSPGLDGD